MRTPAALAALLGALVSLSAAPAAERPEKDTPADRAVARGLAFLAAVQDKSDGAWSSYNGKNPAVTSLAVMAFLSAGHVPGEGKYGEAVERGVRWVLKRQRADGLIAEARDGGHAMYHHGIATLMLAEVAGMTDGALAQEIRTKLAKAVKLILKAQRTDGDERGGWRYQVEHVGGSDMSVTGWQLMALRAAKNVGCDVPAENIAEAVEYIRRSQDERTGGFRYMPHSHVTIPCTGTGILALELCGKDYHRSPETLKAGGHLIRQENLPSWGNGYFFYSIYYGSQATFQLGGNYWEVYRPRLQEVLLRHQTANGSWGGGNSDSMYGPSYCTAMAILALTVEYRYLPIYQRGEEPSGAEK
jgi:hypothetical protein